MIPLHLCYKNEFIFYPQHLCKEVFRMLVKLDMTNFGKKKELKDLHGSLAIPSASHGYSLCIEFAKNWFLEKIHPSYFHDNIYIDGRYALEEFKRYKDIESQVKKKNPALAIIPNIDVNYNREFVDFTPNMVGIDSYITRSRLETPFFEDYDRSIKLFMSMKAIQIAFTYKIRVSTRAEQLDLRDFMSIAYKVGATQGIYINQDYHIPYYLMLTLARDAGFKVKNNTVVDIIPFMQYLNTHSQLPIMYKFRGINGHNEFFVRQRGQYVHIKTESLDKDDGSRKNQLDSDFTIEMNTMVTFPVPQFYCYYSQPNENELPAIIGPANDNIINVYTINITKMPDINDKGWLLYLTTDIVEDKTDLPLYIDSIYDLFRNSDHSKETDIQKIIRYNKEQSIKSDIFMDIKLFNDGNEIPCHVDWNTYELFSDYPIHNKISTMAIYVDKVYINEYIATAEEIGKARVD